MIQLNGGSNSLITSGRVAIISDIHGNGRALDAVFRDVEQNKCGNVVCLGDIIDGGNDNVQVIEEIVKRRIPTVKGNHDDTYGAHLQSSHALFLKNLQEYIGTSDVIYTHVTPRSIGRKVGDEYEAWNVFNEVLYRLIFIGHTHLAFLFAERGVGANYPATKIKYDYELPLRLDRNNRYIISVGSVGYGRDLLGKIRYGIFDYDNYSIEFRTVDGALLDYDYSRRGLFDLP